MNRSFRFFVYIVLASILAACSDAATEKLRTPNSSNTIDAVIAVRHTIATAFAPTEIYILPKGERISSTPVFKADGVEGLRITWNTDSQLTIHAKKARIFSSEPSIEIRVPNKSRPMQIKIALDIPGSK